MAFKFLSELGERDAATLRTIGHPGMPQMQAFEFLEVRATRLNDRHLLVPRAVDHPDGFQLGPGRNNHL